MNWPQFLEQLTRLIDGEDVTVSEVSPATLTQIIALGERRIYREIRSRWNEKTFAVTVTGNLAPIPADWEAISIVHFGRQALIPIAEEAMRDYGGGGGYTKYIAESGPNWTFWPAVSDGTLLQGRYYCRLPNLSATTIATNSLFAAETDLFIYACLSQSAPFFGQDARIPMWEARYQQIKEAVNTTKNRSAYSTGRMMRRPSARILEGSRGFGGYDATPAGTTPSIPSNAILDNNGNPILDDSDNPITG